MLPEYRNEPFVDFSVKANADAMRTALDVYKRQVLILGHFGQARLFGGQSLRYVLVIRRKDVRY